MWQILNQKNRGFTIIELLISLFVLVIGILAAYSVAQLPISYTSVSVNQLTAAYLAQEGIEIVRNIRDTNWLTPDNNWDDGLESGDYEADYASTGLVLLSCSPSCGYNDLSFLKIDSNGFYNKDTGTDTKFKRKITLTPTSDFLTVSVTVFWKDKGKQDPYQFTVQENLYNWK